MIFGNPAKIDLAIDSRAINFENPTGARGAGGMAANGRKGAPSRFVDPGEHLVLADIAGPGKIRHIWMTFPPAPPEDMRGLWMEVFYDGAADPSISVPCLDFFGLPHGRAAPYASALTAAQEGRGFNAYFPMPFARRVRVELHHAGSQRTNFYYQIDYTLEPFDPDEGYLHVLFNRENPTVPMRDFVVAAGLSGPGRFLGCVIGVRVLRDGMLWYGEGEFKAFLDSDSDFPTICGTGLEDYACSAFGLGPHAAPFGGVPVHVAPPPPDGQVKAFGSDMPDFVGFYRWHLMDPIIFRTDFTAVIQQIGAVYSRSPEYLDEHYTPAGNGWRELGADFQGSKYAGLWGGLAERRDDYCATAFLYCRHPQPVPRLDPALALADIGLRDYEVDPSA
ncbi:MAG: hypothetical protein C0499_00050 [Zymomonas sp.]|nr:hypothetical protein [Zymomonas sp.]